MAKITQDTGHLVGDIQQSMLTEAQIQTEYGTGWVLMDGRDVTGSSYATITGNTTLPDARGQFLRGKSHGRSDGQENPDGDVVLGLAQTDAFDAHTHSVATTWGGSNSGTGTSAQNTSGSASGPVGRNVSEAGGNETRPKNITINFFVKIN